MIPDDPREALELHAALLRAHRKTLRPWKRRRRTIRGDVLGEYVLTTLDDRDVAEVYGTDWSGPPRWTWWAPWGEGEGFRSARAAKVACETAGLAKGWRVARPRGQGLRP